MLTHVENFSITLVSHLFSFRGHVRIDIGKKYWEWKHWRFTNEEFNQFLLERQITPYRFQLNNKIYWLFEDKLYRDSEGLSSEDVRALLITRKMQQQSRINRAKSIASAPVPSQYLPTGGSKVLRTAIPDDVKLLV